MAAVAHIMGAPMRAPNLPTILARFEASAGTTATPLQLSRADRAWIGDMIETLIAILDHADGDADLEDGDLDRCLAADDGCGPITDSTHDALWRAAA